MKKVTTRNLLGGFLGGTTGILSSWYISPAFLPLGVLIGGVLGWWNESIVQLFREAHQQAKNTSTEMVDIIDRVHASLASVCGMSTKVVALSRYFIAKTIVGCFGAVVSSPKKLWRALVRLRKWTTSHQMNQVYVIDMIVYMSFMLIIPPVAFLIEPYFGISSGKRGLLTIPTAFAVWGGSLIYLMQHEAVGDPELIGLNQFYRRWEVISHHGSFVYLLYTIGQSVRYWIGAALIVTIVVPLSSGIIMVIGIGFYLLYAGIFIARVFYNLASQTEHRLCLGVTMVVTGISWFVYHESFADPRILWTVALGTGVVSGGVTEIIRRVMLPICENTSIGRHLTANEAALDIVLDYVGVVVRVAFLRSSHSRLVRMFLAMCLGFRVARQA